MKLHWTVALYEDEQNPHDAREISKYIGRGPTPTEALNDARSLLDRDAANATGNAARLVANLVRVRGELDALVQP